MVGRDSAHQLTSNPLAHITTHNKHKNTLVSIIISTFPSTNTNLILDPICDPIPLETGLCGNCARERQ